MLSSSVQAGLAAHENPMQPIASDNKSPRIEGNELPDGKYAWNRGCCQWVICKKDLHCLGCRSALGVTYFCPVKLIYPREKETGQAGIPIDSGGSFIVARQRDNVPSENKLRRRVRKKYIDAQFLREHYLGSEIKTRRDVVDVLQFFNRLIIRFVMYHTCRVYKLKNYFSVIVSLHLAISSHERSSFSHLFFDIKFISKYLVKYFSSIL